MHLNLEFLPPLTPLTVHPSVLLVDMSFIPVYLPLMLVILYLSHHPLPPHHFFLLPMSQPKAVISYLHLLIVLLLFLTLMVNLTLHYIIVHTIVRGLLV